MKLKKENWLVTVSHANGSVPLVDWQLIKSRLCLKVTQLTNIKSKQKNSLLEWYAAIGAECLKVPLTFLANFVLGVVIKSSWSTIFVFISLVVTSFNCFYLAPAGVMYLFLIRILFPNKVAWPSGLRRWFKAPVSSEAWVQIPPLPINFVNLLWRGVLTVR